jgi:ElaB/YqjD/DUF883 family membrane-anchored ribosome-binding protein
MSDAQEKISNAVNEGVNRAEEKLGDVANTAAERTAGLRDKARDVVDRTRSALNEGYEQASDKGREYLNRGKEYAQRGYEAAGEWEETLEGQIRQRPLVSILIAAGVGLLAGVLLSNRDD